MPRCVKTPCSPKLGAVNVRADFANLASPVNQIDCFYGEHRLGASCPLPVSFAGSASAGHGMGKRSESMD